MRPLVVGTRGSALALWQARHVAGLLRRAHPGIELVERIVDTEGDRDKQRPIGIQDYGVYVRSLERALLSREIDLAVHSLKDLPTAQPPGLVLAAIPSRHDPRDALITRDGRGFAELPAGTVIGTGSYRRRTQLLHHRPELATAGIRGNVDTRVGKLDGDKFGALVLAVAGLERLGIDRRPFVPLAEEICLPAAGQGALAIEVRDDDQPTRELVAPLDDPAARAEITAERSFLGELGGGCLAPATAFARFRGGTLQVSAIVGDADGVTLLRERTSGPAPQAGALGTALASTLVEQGAKELLDQAREAARRDGRA